MYTTVGTYYSFWMTVCHPGWIGTEFQSNQDNRQSSKKRIISTNCLKKNNSAREARLDNKIHMD